MIIIVANNRQEEGERGCFGRMVYDLVVVGAGPAGSHLARLAANCGWRVALLEKARLPRYKACGGGLTVKSYKIIDLPLNDFVEDKVVRLGFTYQGQRPVFASHHQPLLMMVMRDKLDQKLAEAAAAAGADFLPDCPVEQVVENSRQVKVCLPGGKFLESNFLAGADGAFSIVRRCLPFAVPVQKGVALEAEVPAKEQELRRWQGSVVLNHGSVTRGYDWIFPKKEHISVGTGTFSPRAVHLRSYLASYLQSLGFNPESARYKGHPIPTLGRGRLKLHTNRSLLVGDAAALVNPFTGEGIYNALLSAELAFLTLAEISARYASLTDYTRRVKENILPSLRQAATVANLVYTFPGIVHGMMENNPSILELLFRILGGEADYQDLYAMLKRRMSPWHWLHLKTSQP